MITIINAHLREGVKGSYVSLELQGDVELVQSQNTGRFYATARRCFVYSTFSEQVAKSLIGKSLAGSIRRVKCDPYEYALPESGEIVTLAHTYQYFPEENPVTAPAIQLEQMLA